MAYRRRQGIGRASTFKEESLFHPRSGEDGSIPSDSKLTASHTFTTSSSLAAQAIKASAAHRDSSLSSAYIADTAPQQSFGSNKVSAANDDRSSGRNETSGFWGVVARKAKAILDDDDVDSQQHNSNSSSSRFDMPGHSSRGSSPPFQGFKKMDNPKLRKGLNKITSSLNHIGDTFEKAFEEGRTIVQNKTANIIQETRKLQVRRQGSDLDELHNEVPSANNSSWQPLTVSDNPRNHETQLKASRDVAMATAAKSKLLLRELKTVKADLAFAKLRCSQLEEENKGLRESREKGGNHADDDLIRLQLETLLAEKARLAHENSQYARENRFLREIVEYHQLTMQDVVYMDEGSEEVTEVYMLSMSPAPPPSPPSSSDTIALESQMVTKDVNPTLTSIQKMLELPPIEVQQNVVASMPEQAEAETVLSSEEEDDKRASNLKKDCADIPTS